MRSVNPAKFMVETVIDITNKFNKELQYSVLVFFMISYCPDLGNYP